MYQYTQIQFIKRKEYYDVIVYYSRNGEKFRPLTGVKILHKHLTKSGTISSSHPNLDEDSRKIKEVQDRVENLAISYKERYGEKPPVEWLEKQFEKKLVDTRKDLQDAMCYWLEFLSEKKEVVRSVATVNNYNNLYRALEKFSGKKNQRIAFNTLDQKFFNDFLSYLINEHEHVRHKNQLNEGLAVPEVGVTNETAIKRLKDFNEYLKYCVVEHDVDLKLEKIKKYMKLAKHKLEIRPLSKTQMWELTLTPDEIQFVVNLDHFEPEFWGSLSDNQKRYLDILMFMCLQGTAPIDTKDIRRTDIRNGQIIKQRSKSGNEFKVELDPIAEEILSRNNYNLDFVDQTVNDQLKKLFVTVFELYSHHYERKMNEQYQLICTQKTKKGDKEVFAIMHKGLFVEMMTGRRSFLTNLGEKAGELGIKEMMNQAGHTVISTTLGYIHESQQPKKAKGGLFGIFKIGKK